MKFVAKKLIALLLSALMLCTVIPALGEAGVYTALYSSEVTTLNYLITSNAWDQTVGANVIDTLVEYNSVGEIIPSLAEKWEPSEDGLTWTFTLREGLKWVDNMGNEVADLTASDFAAAIKYVLTPEYESTIEGSIETANIKNAAAYYAGEIKDFAEVGVKAPDARTLVFELSAPVPYFLSMMTYGCFMPAYGPQLEELGKDFATDNTKMYYCGAYRLETYEPQQEHVYVKNASNWDAEHIYIEKIDRKYNTEASTLAPGMALRGEVDAADITSDILDDWRQNYPQWVTKGRSDLQYSYFFCFNFKPTFDAEYEPDNWAKAVDNPNFRHAIMSALDRTYTLRVDEPDDPETLVLNYVTPVGFAADGNGDFTNNPAFDGILDNYFNAEKALEYKAKAVEELTAAGVTFPVKIMYPYNANSSNWGNESILVEQQLESVLGSDFIDIIVYQGQSQSYLTDFRRSGNYAFQRCNWGADYADPETWADPFNYVINEDGSYGSRYKYGFPENTMNGDAFPQTKPIMEAYYAKVAEARASVTDMNERYSLFAEAEAMLINNAIVIPYRFELADYMVTKIDVYEGEYAAFGICNYRFKFQKVQDEFITAEQNEASKAAWLDKKN